MHIYLLFSVLTHTLTNFRKLKKQGLTYLLEHDGYWLPSKAETVAWWLQACELKLSHGEKKLRVSHVEKKVLHGEKKVLHGGKRCCMVTLSPVSSVGRDCSGFGWVIWFRF